jgi:uncharacterized protein (PEP-CTERM system associated)
MARIILMAMTNQMQPETHSVRPLEHQSRLHTRLFLLAKLCGTGCLCIATAMVSTAHAGELELTYGVGFTEAISDNVDLASEGQEETALISDVIGNFRLRSSSARIKATYDASATLRFQNGGEEDGFSLLPEMRGFGNYEAIEDLFFVDTSSSVSQQVLDSRAGDTQSNQETVQTHRVSPYLVNRFGGFASAELRYSFDKTITEDDSASTGAAVDDNRISDTTTQTASFSLTSGIDFSRLAWSINARASESERTDDNDISRRSITLNTEYAVVRSFSLIGSLGYERFEEEEQVGGTGLASADDFSGMTWRTGFRWRPGRRTDLEMTYGRGDDDESLDAKLGYNISPRTRLTASYAERLESGEERFVRNLTSIGEDPITGELIDTSTGLPFDPSTGPTSLVSDLTRTKTFRADLNGTRGRNSFRVGALHETQEDDTPVLTSDEETSIGVDGSWTRRLNPRTNFRLQGSFVNTEFSNENREDKEYSITTGLDYNLFSNINAFANYNYRRQDSDLKSEEYIENRITFGARANF